MNFNDLCDDVLFQIFSYLNLEDGIRLPLVCKRFQSFIRQYNLPVPTTSSMELETLKLSSKKNFSYDRVFGKLGSHLKKFTIDGNEDAFEVDLIMKSIGKYCHNVETMIVRLLYANTVKRLPKSLRNLTVGDFRARSLDVRALYHLEKLSLISSYALDEVKVHQPVKEFHLQLRLGDRMPDPAKINRLTTTVSEKFAVELHSSYSDASYFYAGSVDQFQTVQLNDLNQIINLKLFTMNFYFATVDGIKPSNIRSTKMSCKCGLYVPLSMNTLFILLDNYRGPKSTPATKVVRYTPETNLTIEFEFDDYEDRYKYFERLRLHLPCHCASVEVLVVLD
ncbi:hypothetical protein HA402_003024 [Bradysia odoriphaga]|nr:hypothetical protein HA402_003024 [Bradysia odoriphaga]